MLFKLQVKQSLYHICTTLSEYFVLYNLHSQTEGINITTTQVTEGDTEVVDTLT